jgi:YidC/Oxa1 family membrane protein insertase
MKTDWLRKIILGGILVLGFILFIRWNEFQEKHHAIQSQAPAPSAAATETAQNIPKGNEEFNLPAPTATQKQEVEKSLINASVVSVRTDSLWVEIDTQGGDIRKVSLPKNFAQLNTPDVPFVLLDNTTSRTYIAKSGLAGPNGTDSASGRPQFSVSADAFTLAEGQNELTVDLAFAQPEATITKRFIFTRGSNLIKVKYLIKNNSDQPWQASLVGSIKRDSYNPSPAQMFAMNPFIGAATSTNEKNYYKLTFSDIADTSFKHEKEGGWLALIQHYFLTAWIPPQDSKNAFNFQKIKDEDLYILSFTSAPTLVGAHSEGSIEAGFYAGPKDMDILETIAPHLDLTMDYSWLWWLAKPMFKTLDLIHGVVQNWGVAIILLTVLIKAILFYPSAISYKSMARMRKVQPKMQALKERYGDDKQKMSQELMKLYRDEKVNPVSGCLPMLMQMPVFLALYWVLMEAVELRQAPFCLWIQDLSVKDPYFVLPLVMGLTMYFQQKLNPTPPDPMQAKMMQMMPIFFTFLFVFFPAGLVLYWVVNNTLSILQQYIITKQIENSDK